MAYLEYDGQTNVKDTYVLETNEGVIWILKLGDFDIQSVQDSQAHHTNNQTASSWL